MLKLNHVKVMLLCQFGYFSGKLRIIVLCRGDRPSAEQACQCRGGCGQQVSACENTIDLKTVVFKFFRVL